MTNLKIGALLCIYNNIEHLQNGILEPWLNTPCINQLSIINTRFKETDQTIKEDGTIGFLQNINQSSNKTTLNISNDPLMESEARTIGLKPLLENNDYVFIFGGDEYFTTEQLQSIIKYIGKNLFITWFSLPYKNYIFSGKEYIKGFCPPRIFKVDTPSYKLKEFYWDDDVTYEGKKVQDRKDYKHMSTKKIPESIINGGIRHLTWLHQYGKAKVEYQQKHFNHCGFKWDEMKGKLAFDEAYYNKMGEPIPTVYED